MQTFVALREDEQECILKTASPQGSYHEPLSRGLLALHGPPKKTRASLSSLRDLPGSPRQGSPDAALPRCPPRVPFPLRQMRLGPDGRSANRIGLRTSGGHPRMTA
jgi:hypothetical protein